MIQKTISGNDIVSEAIERIREYEPENGYYLAFSGGKDSICIYQLSKLAGVKFRAVYSMTSIDPKGVPQFIRKYYPDVEIVKPTYKGKRTNFYDLVSQKGLPRRQYRWCCDVLKEGGGNKGDTVMLGVRQAESLKRSKRDSHSLFIKSPRQTPLADCFGDW